ncbi:hypothetical protein pipiens_008285 [Culex pipiens pipiens]|uniref:Peptidase S1 domain-containing protein n=1 Tax=Culex pipiens pipiens TaxID=38569 RepID=A0ABD1DIF0_CULPP
MKVCSLVLIWLISESTVDADSFECGRRKIKLNKAIVRGQDTSPGEWPWHAAVYRRTGFSDSYVCGGTLISDKFLLTADHCTKDDNGNGLVSKRIFIRLGVHNLQALNLQTLQQHDVLHVHRFGYSKGVKNDIAILELSTEVRFTEYVQPACINQVPDLTDQLGTVVGWGVTETDALTPVLKSSRMPAIGSIQCIESDRDIFGATLDRSLFCAGYTNGTTVCNGDSGGGIHFERDGAWYVGGLVSFTGVRDSGHLCRTKGYAGFTNVFHFLPWIWNITQLTSLAQKNNVVTLHTGEDPISSRTYPNYLPRNCGTRIVNRITRGQRANLYEFPWMAVLVSDEDFCMGTLISKRYVLTTIQCSRNPSPYQVKLGDYDIHRDRDCNVNDPTDCAPSTRLYDIEFIVLHQSYSRETRHNDIALVRLKTEVSFDDHIQPVCLPVTPQLQRMTFTEFTIAGWGVTDQADNLASILQKAKVPATECNTHSIARKRFPVDSASQICLELVTSDGPIACIGDLGGLLGNTVQFDNGLRFVQFGVVSYGKAACGKGPWIYTNVTHFMPWIRANLAA